VLALTGSTLHAAAIVRKILVIVHQETSEAGLIGQVLEENGYTLDIRRPCLEEALPETMDDHEGTVVFGGPMSANDDDTLPFIRAELEWIPTAIASGKPYLGICLGAQLLARVLGATVAPHPEAISEIGYVPITPTTPGQAFFKGLSMVYHWHREGFELPKGAVLLAKGDVFPHQAFRYGRSLYGLQFHPEITASMMDRWTTLGAEHLTRPEAQSREEQMHNHSRYALAVETWLRGFLPHWLQSADLVLPKVG
jgi:GMP synthase (glutamine-hydrolysing)